MFKNLGFEKIYSDFLADEVGSTSSQVRKDFSLFRIKGNKRGGYCVEELLVTINKILGKGEVQNVIIVGAGNLGTALAGYRNFEREGIRIIACFDIDPVKLHKKFPVPLYPFHQLSHFVKEHDVRIGIIAVPGIAAEEVLEVMVDSGIKGILNFAPVTLKPPQQDCCINNVNLEIELENIIYFVKNRSGSKMQLP